MGGHANHLFATPEVGESSTTGPELIKDTSEKVSSIRQRLIMAQIRQKSYTD